VLSKAQKEQITSSSLKDWIKEVHELTNQIYEQLPEDTNLGYEYRYLNFDTVRMQLLKSGLRLAAVLDEVFK